MHLLKLYFEPPWRGPLPPKAGESNAVQMQRCWAGVEVDRIRNVRAIRPRAFQASGFLTFKSDFFGRLT